MLTRIIRITINKKDKKKYVQVLSTSYSQVLLYKYTFRDTEKKKTKRD